MQSPSADFVFHSRDEAARHYWYLPHSERPPGADTQWLTLRVRFDRFLAASPASHFAVVLRAKLGFDEAGVPLSISGRGLTLGDTSLARPPAGNPFAHAPGFGGVAGSQVESFWPGGNFLYRDAAARTESLRDDCWYRVQLHVSDARWVAISVELDDSTDEDPHWPMVQDRSEHPVAEDATGALIALGRGEPEHGEWSVEFRDIRTGWF